MKELSFKNYPPKILAAIICIIITCYFLFNALWSLIWKQEDYTLTRQLACILSASSAVIGALSFVNKHIMWAWYLKLLGIYNVSGIYNGFIISSFHEDDDPDKVNVMTYCKLQIIQNINGMKIEGAFYSEEAFTNQKSASYSSWEEIKKKDNGDFLIRYFFTNEGNRLHEHDRRYGLNNHNGVAVLTFYPKTGELSGYYFTHERSSFGKMNLKRN
jgi:hypothetical protein